jgi:NTE family protein
VARLSELSDVELYERGVQLLRHDFKGSSKRLLIDLVRWTAEKGPRSFGVVNEEGNELVFLALEGRPRLARGTKDVLPLRPGINLFNADAFDPHVSVDVEVDDDDTRYVAFTVGLSDRGSDSLKNLGRLSPVLLRGLTLSQRVNGLTSSERVRKKPVLLWSSGEDGTPIEALTRLLGEAIATRDKADKADQVAIVTLAAAGPPRVERWIDGAFQDESPDVERPSDPLGEAELRGIIQQGHVLVVNPDRPRELPGIAPEVLFDQVTYVTDRIPDEVPPVFARRMAWLKDGEPFFNSFVASIVRRPAPPTSLLSGLVDRLLSSPQSPFGTRRIGPAARGNVYRDACPVLIDVPALDKAWTALGGAPKPFLTAVDSSIADGARRWARAVTNERYGVALSGGGAAAFRSVAVLEAMADNSYHVDVLGGLSGGALVGAYYCAHRSARGVERFARDRGPLLQVILPVVFLTTYPLELLVDFDLNYARVEDCPIRFAAVTTALSLEPKTPPVTKVVERGTFGEAVRASGTLPPAFAPTEKNRERFTDGGAASMVPSRVVRDCGADYVLAANLIPGPENSNPFEDYRLGRFARERTPIGRLLDMWTWYAYLWSQASREAGDEADVFFDFKPEAVSFLDCFNWWGAEDIVRRARGESARIDDDVRRLPRPRKP